MRKLLVMTIALLLLTGCGGESGGGAPQIVLETTTLELGEMPNGEIAEREVTVHNDGDAPLVVEMVTTSCGCTTAVLEPMTIAPGKNGVLRIAFDSGAHGPELRGPLMREVKLVSNDPGSPEMTVAVLATILPPSDG